MAAAEPKARTVMLPPPLTKEGEQDCSAIAEGDLVVRRERLTAVWHCRLQTPGFVYYTTLDSSHSTYWL